MEFQLNQSSWNNVNVARHCLTPVAPRETPRSIAIVKMYASTSTSSVSVSVSVSAIRRSAFRGRRLPRTGTDVVVKVVDDPRQQRTRGGGRRRRCATTTTRAMEAAPRRELEKISSSEEFEAAIAESEDRVVVVDFMATWCRKCVFLKGKLEKYASRHDPNAVKFCVVDVNAVPQAMIRQCGVTKMPTLQIYRGSEKVWELIAGEDGESVLRKLTFAIEEEQQKGKKKTSKSAR